MVNIASRRVSLLAVVGLCSLSLAAGCRAPARNATRAQVVRYQLTTDTQEQINRQTLIVELDNGGATLLENANPVYSAQLEPAVAQQWRGLRTRRSWPSTRRGKASDLTLHHYELTFHKPDRRVGRRVRWSWPAEDKLPDPQAWITQSFNRIERRANPLSESINLLE